MMASTSRNCLSLIPSQPVEARVPRIGYNRGMNWDDDWIPYAAALATVVTVAVGFSLFDFWFG